MKLDEVFLLVKHVYLKIFLLTVSLRRFKRGCEHESKKLWGVVTLAKSVCYLNNSN